MTNENTFYNKFSNYKFNSDENDVAYTAYTVPKATLCL